MADLLSWPPGPRLWLLLGFHAVVVVLLTLDLGVVRRRAQAVSTREAAAWSAVWVAVALAADAGLWLFWHRWYPDAPPETGAVKAVEFLTAYLVELSLSVDNLFVFQVPSG